ncbi:uncharacterized phosphotransferase YvkC-like [Anoplolepis gracilipes]|uniref:uncharacterized phosphotransferase YvkC-like n=1 Tax=Anoplolepis gracilipes TaxID=354296 RepID=UPI003BA312AB
MEAEFIVPQGFCVTSLVLERQLQHHKQLQDLINDIKDISRGKKKEDLKTYCEKSSTVGEDSEGTSAAGQNSTYLGVKDANDIIKCVGRQNGLPIKVSMGICIQKMIDEETASVMFTRHPTTGDPSSIIITANYGLGEICLIDIK